MTYTVMEDLPTIENYELATDIALAAICGEGVYNLGEVVVTPILSYLKGTPNAWLQDVIIALYQGDITQFNKVLDDNRDKYFAHSALATNHDAIKKKAVILCVVNIAFNRDPHDRKISFVEIADKAHIPLDQVEWVLMKALSIGIVKGCIDQVDQFISVSWVQPRVLDPSQIHKVSGQILAWAER
jgi:26S proteasome regulatory subunit N9